MAKENDKELVRRDPTGHLNPRYASGLLQLSGNHKDTDPLAFVNTTRTRVDLAEALAEGAVFAMTGGSESEPSVFDPVAIEEWGGPFIVIRPRGDVASDVDEEELPKTAFPGQKTP